MTNANAAALYSASVSAWNKARFNKGKMDFMAFANNGLDPYGCEKWVADLETLFADAKAATDKFTAAVAGLSAGEIVKIIEAAG